MTSQGARKGAGFSLHQSGIVIPALSLTQPWAWAILHAGKPVENRTWPTKYRGPLWLHAAKTMRRADYYNTYALVSELAPGKHHEMPSPETITRAAFVGLTWVIGCLHNIEQHLFLPDAPTSWAFAGQYGWTLDLSRTWSLSEPLPALGALRLWCPNSAEAIELAKRLPPEANAPMTAWMLEQRPNGAQPQRSE